MEDQLKEKRLMKLSSDTLNELPDAVQRPIYDRSKLTAGIVHIGVGNFHRGHQAWYLHRLMQRGFSFDWAIVGAGVRAYDAEMREKLLAQDCLTTLIELDPASSSAEVIGSMIDYLPIEDGNNSLVQRMACEDIRIVSMTVTEGGYFIDPATKGFDAKHPDIVYDSLNPESPKTAFGAIVAALRIRRENAVGPFTCLSCDNLQGNGDILRQAVVTLAQMSDLDLADWIEKHCTFPNSMVDCIVPATGQKELTLVRELGIEDDAPVTHENYRQWVIEDDFCNGRPDWDAVGAQFTDKVHDFEMMKLRILNGGHQVVSVPAEVLGIETISESVRHPLIRAMFCKIAQQELVPHIKAVPGLRPDVYVDLILKRFENPEIVDTVRRVAFDGSSRHPGFVLPSIRDGLASGKPIDGLVLLEAIWARMCEGTREDGSIIEPNDPYWGELQSQAKAARNNPAAWLELRNIYGDLADEPLFSERFASTLSQIWDQGVEATIKTYLGE